MLRAVSRILLYCATGLLTLAMTSGAEPESFHATDLQGNEVRQLATNNARVVVLIFAATDCPISNRYIPEIARLEQEFSSRHIAFWWIFPNPGDTRTAILKHQQEYAIHVPILIDSRQNLVHLAHAAVTPEAAVFTAENGMLHETYHGRIDDRYAAFGKERPQAAHHDLSDAIHAALAGHAAPSPHTDPIGCSIIPIASEQHR
jgi:AhpC/TSA family